MNRYIVLVGILGFSECYSMRLSCFFKKLAKFLKLQRGYVFVLTLVLLPVVLFGAKYIVDNQSLHRIMLLKTRLKDKSESNEHEEEYYKKCAKNAALAVAKKWNPALNYKQQKESVLRVADEVYNKSPTSYDDRLISEAIPGFNIETKGKADEAGGMYSSIKLKTKEVIELSPEQKQIEYESVTVPLVRYYYRRSYDTNNIPFAWYAAYYMHSIYTNSNMSLFTTLETDDLENNSENSENSENEVNLFKDFCLSGDENQPLSGNWLTYMVVPKTIDIIGSSGEKETGITMTYTERKNPDDETVRIECEDDRIKVITDNDVGYAVPAECNVDIVLTVPTNSAALNKENRDLNTNITGESYVSAEIVPTSDAKSTPIYQISRAYQDFLKDFFYTRGVNVGIIPYSGNVSLASQGSSIDRSLWVKEPDNFVSSYFTNRNNWRELVEDNRYIVPTIMGAMLYGALGDSKTSEGNLSPDVKWAGKDKLYALLCRGDPINLEGNTLTKGNLLSVADPYEYKFRKQVYNTCVSGNLLSCKCERFRNHLANPYYIIELNPDLLYIYYMLMAFYPYYDNRNQSNFIFIPVTWCNNLFQEWSATGENKPIDTVSDSKSLGRLSTPSKLTRDRKKVLILTINKPDWFEPGELTYIGFDNDYSDTPAVESDTIRFDINYGDTEKKYADGSVYNGTVQGQKKILQYETINGTVSYTEGYYQCTSATGRLTYPQKYLVKLIVEPKNGAESGVIRFTNILADLNGASTEAQTIDSKQEFYITPEQQNVNYIEFEMTNIKLISAEITNHPFRMVDGKPDLGKGFKNPERSIYIDIMNMANEGKFKYENESGEEAIYGEDQTGNITNTGIKKVSTSKTSSSKVTVGDWIEGTNLPNNNCNNQWAGVCYGKDKFVAVIACSNLSLQSKDGIDWTSVELPLETNWKAIVFANGMFCVFSCDNVITSEDGTTWNVYTYSKSLDDIVGIAYGGDKFVALTGSNKAVYSSDGINWTEVAINNNSNLKYTSICYGSNKFIAVSSTDISYSTNGSNWYNTAIAAIGEASICYGDNSFIVVGTLAGLHSYDGINWNRISVITGSSQMYLAYGVGIFVGIRCSEENDIICSSDGTNWDKMSDKLNIYSKFICYGNKKFIVQKDCTNEVYCCAVQLDLDLERLRDGTEMDKEIPCSGRWSSACYGAGKFVVVAKGSYIAAYSENGIDWYSTELPAFGEWIGVFFGESRYYGDLFIAMSAKRQSIVSFDGIDWYGPFNVPLQCSFFCYGGGIFVGIPMGSNNNTYAMYSRDGVNWSISSRLPSSTKILGLCYGNVNGSNVFVATGLEKWDYYTDAMTYGTEQINYGIYAFRDGATMYSEDGINWRLITQKFVDGEESVCGFSCCFGGNRFIILNQQWCFWSYDGKDWNREICSGASSSSGSGYSKVLSIVCYGGGVFVAAPVCYPYKGTTSINFRVDFVKCSNDGIFWYKLGTKDGRSMYVNEGHSLPSARYYSYSLCYSDDLKRFIMFDSGGGNYVYADVDKNAQGFDPWHSSAPGLTEWKEGNNLPSNNCSNMWAGMCFGKGKFLAVATPSSIVAYSEDGENWDCTVLPTSEKWFTTLFAQEKFWLFSHECTAVSDDGIQWTVYRYSERLFPSMGANVFGASGNGSYYGYYEKEGSCWGIAYGANMFVAIGATNYGYYSSDGIHWNEVIIGSGGVYYTAICYGDGKFVALGYNGGMAYSKDGINWTSGDFPDLSTINVTYGGDRFVATNKKYVDMYSYDGINWERQDSWIRSLAYYSKNLTLVSYGSGVFFSLAMAVSNSYYCPKYSIDGSSWEIIQVSSSFCGGVGCYGKRMFIMIDASDNILYRCKISSEYSLSSTTFDSSGRWIGSCYGNGKFVTVARGSNKVAYSVNGTEWKLETLPVRDNWTAVCYGQGRFVAMSEIQTVYSEDGINWRGPNSIPVKCKFYCYGGGVFVGVPSTRNNYAIYSTDGENWNKSDKLPCQTKMLSVCYGEIGEEGMFIATGNDPSKVIIYSYNGITWELASNNISGNICCFAKDRFVMFSDQNIYSSKNGLSWSLLSPNSDLGYIVCYGSGLFVRISAPIEYESENNQEELISYVYLSTDAANWTRVELKTARYYSRSLCYSEELHRFIVFDSGGSNYIYCDVEEEIVEEEGKEGTNWCFYSNDKNNSINHNLILNRSGDMFVITDADPSEGYSFNLGTTSYDIFKTTRSENGLLTNSKLKNYIGAGLYRMVIPIEDMFYDESLKAYKYKWEINALDSEKLVAMYMGATLPANLTLYHYVDPLNGIEMGYPYQFIENYERITTYDAIDAVKKVTRDACTKLKNDWGEDLKVYLIKFRKQNEYLHKITKTPETFDYSYLNKCATDENHIYDVKTEQQLKKALARISSDIKEWANAQEAVNV